MLHFHVTSWAIALILFAVSYALLKSGKMKGQKITQMILRVFYILVAGTGIGLVFSYNFWTPTIFKGILAIILIGLMEMILIKGRKKEGTGMLWVLFLIDLVAVFIFGYAVIG